MGKILGNLNLALATGAVLLLAAMFAFHSDVMDGAYFHYWVRFFHVISGVLWIGLL